MGAPAGGEIKSAANARAAGQPIRPDADSPLPSCDERIALLAGALAMLAARPAARSPHAFLKLLLGPANSALPSHLLLGVLNPADEFVTRQRRDVPPGSERLGVGDQRRAQICRQLVHHPTGHSLAAPSRQGSRQLSLIGRGRRIKPRPGWRPD